MMHHTYETAGGFWGAFIGTVIGLTFYQTGIVKINYIPLVVATGILAGMSVGKCFCKRGGVIHEKKGNEKQEKNK